MVARRLLDPLAFNLLLNKSKRRLCVCDESRGESQSSSFRFGGGDVHYQGHVRRGVYRHPDAMSSTTNGTTAFLLRCSSPTKKNMIIHFAFGVCASFFLVYDLRS